MSIGVIKFLSSIIFALVVLKIILPARDVEQITIPQLHEQLQNKKEHIQFIDVRPRGQYDRFHVFGFQNIPLRDLRKQVENLDKDKPVVTICQTGAQGNRACKRLKRYGFKKLANVRGGLSMWEPIHQERKQ
ncbi:MAG TPA: rhodanese-like domain-containing protein [Pseudogracilibacillus sp.]|nr:rhodanese-like domain-containing protein [Pseudogracilibacillus sp.]